MKNKGGFREKNEKGSAVPDLRLDLDMGMYEVRLQPIAEVRPTADRLACSGSGVSGSQANANAVCFCSRDMCPTDTQHFGRSMERI
jgi:hypothetical protein